MNFNIKNINGLSWVIAVIAVVQVINLSVLALSLHNGYESDMTWSAWRFFTVFSVMGLAGMVMCRDSLLIAFVPCFALLAWTVTPLSYVFLVIRDGQFAVGSTGFISVSPYVSAMVILIMSVVIFVYEKILISSLR